MQNRILFIDILKGFTILCVVVGHLGVWHITSFMQSFHMPLFFILSGFFFNSEKPIFRRLTHLIKPYLLTGLAILAITSCHSLILLFTESSTNFSGIIEILKSIFFGSAETHFFLGVRFDGIGVIWFLLALCWATLIVWILAKLNLNQVLSLVISFILLCVGWQSTKICFLPLGFQPGLIGSFFVCMGGWLYKNKLWNHNKNIILGGGVWLFSLYFSYINKVYLGIAACRFPYFPIDVIGSLGATIVLLALFQWLEKQKYFPSRFLLFFGQATLVVLCFHGFELYKIDWRIREICDLYDLGRIPTLGILMAFKLSWAAMGIYLCRYITALRKSRSQQAIPQSTD